MMGARLICTGGPSSGEEFTLEEGEYVIGRSAENPICIPDTSVSRKHVLVRNVGGGWAASDLGSGNGTLLNGEPITDEVPLAHGDILTLGDSELTFQDASNATMMMPMPAEPPARKPARKAPPAPTALATTDADEATVAPASPRRPPPRPERVRSTRSQAALSTPDPAAGKRKRRLLLLTTSVFVLLALLLVAIKVKQQEEAEIAAREALAIQQRREQLDALFQEAKNLVREGRWLDAKAKLEELQELEPGYVMLPEYLARVQKEIPNQDALDAAKAALEKSELGPAAAALAQVSRDTQLFEQVRTLRADLEKLADLRVREAQSLLEARKLDEAKIINDDVLSALPTHRDAKVIGEQIQRAIEIRDRPPPPPTPGQQPKAWEPAIERFRDGDLPGAVAVANACAGKHSKCKTLLGQMTEFGNLYKKLEDLDARGLTRLLDLDRRITDGRGSKLARNAGTRAANIFYKSASAAKAAGQWSRATENALRALQADPHHNGANAIVTELRQKAKELYLQAYTIKDSNPEDALPKFKEVLSMTSPDDETHQKAKSWIEKLSR
jgi:tetratricopeptide (TPR) repeat protein